MENPIPDLIYYQRIVDDPTRNKSDLRDELQDLINEVKDYLASQQKSQGRI